MTAEELPARKRARINNKREDHVYKANSEGQGEHLDTEEQRKAAQKLGSQLFAIDPAMLTPPKKNRGRPSKAYLEALEEYNRQVKLLEERKAEGNTAEGVMSPTDSISASPAQETAEGAENVQEGEGSGHPSEEVAKESQAALPNDGGVSFVVSDTFIVLRDVAPLVGEFQRIHHESLHIPKVGDIGLKAGSSQSADSSAQSADSSVQSADSSVQSADSENSLSTIENPEQEAVPSTAEAGEDEGVKEKKAAQPQEGKFAVKTDRTPQVHSSMTTYVSGVLELERDNSGFLRSADYNYLPSPDDVMVSSAFVRRYGLRTGDTVEGMARMPISSERTFIMTEIIRAGGLEVERVRDRVPFEALTPLFPDEKFQLCTGAGDSMSCRIVDMFSPIGKGQRALIVAQPKTGKTLLMKDVANAIARNHPDTHLIMLLIDERPEEVTDMARTVNAEVIASTFDEPASSHVRIANIVMEKAKRMVECGHDVVIFLDSITRLARAYNTVAPASSKILTGGVDAYALQKPKRFFGAARNIENGGSLTIIATALIDTGSKMDEVIFEEFKGTGNMELQLERQLANKRIFPAVNLMASSTRRDDLLLDELTQNRMWALRNYLADMNSIEAMKFLRSRLENTRDNKEFIASING